MGRYQEVAAQSLVEFEYDTTQRDQRMKFEIFKISLVNRGKCTR